MMSGDMDDKHFTTTQTLHQQFLSQIFSHEDGCEYELPLMSAQCDFGMPRHLFLGRLRVLGTLM